MAMMKRAYGGVQPCIKAGVFRIRIPFIHFKISPPEVVTGIMNACSSYGALAVLITTLGLDPEVAWALVIFETCMYTLNWVLGEPSICGWITPAMAIMVAFLETLEPGAARLQAMTAIELELGILFLILGFTGTAKKLNTLIPPAMKAGIVLGAGVNAITVRLKVGGPIDTVTWGCIAGIFCVYMLMYSQRVRKRMDKSRVLQVLGNYSFLWTMIILMVVGGVAGEFDFNFSGEIFKWPDFGALFATCSPFSIGWAEPSMWLMAAPYALAAWIIAYGDFITVQQLGLQAVRDDEYIEFDPNRTNVVCGIRNVILSLFAPYPALAGPLSAPYTIATYQRYKQAGRQGMDSIYDGAGTNLIFTVIGLFIYPIYEASLAASAAILVVVLMLQGWVCAIIAMGIVRDDLDKGISGVMAGAVIARGAAVGIGVGLAFYLFLCDNDKIREDYAYNKEKQRIEDEETDRQLKALHERMEAFKRGEIVED